MGVIRIDHPSYFGFRAQRSAAGETRRRYFSLRLPDERTGGTRAAKRREEAEIRLEAEACDAEFAHWQAKARRATVRLAAPLRPSNNTGVRGIVFNRDHSETRRGRVYRFPALAVSVLDTAGKAITRRIRVQPGEEEDAWRRACRIVAAAKGIAPAPLYRRFPARVIAFAKRGAKRQASGRRPTAGAQRKR